VKSWGVLRHTPVIAGRSWAISLTAPWATSAEVRGNSPFGGPFTLTWTVGSFQRGESVSRQVGNPHQVCCSAGPFAEVGLRGVGRLSPRSSGLWFILWRYASALPFCAFGSNGTFWPLKLA